MPEVNITLDSTGGRLMSNHSRSNIGNPMATVYSEYSQSETGQSIEQSEVISVATIQSTLGNRFRITGAGSMADAQNLALLLRLLAHRSCHHCRRTYNRPTLVLKTSKMALRHSPWDLVLRWYLSLVGIDALAGLQMLH